jgi:LPXTG-motif cell wall-anchored protein
MKLSCAILLLAATAASATKTIRGNAAKTTLLGKARRLEDQNNNNGDGDNAEEEQFAFLYNYSIKMIGCVEGEKYQNPESGEYEANSVVFRLCPADTCESACNKGYGDFTVGLNTYVEAWLEDKKDDMQNDDNFNVDEYSECREYEVDNGDDDGGNAYEGYSFYVGPTCGDADDIKMGFFTEYTCTTESTEVTFADISNGWTLPYSTGGLVTDSCETCAGYADDGTYELSEMCSTLYANAGSRCEASMEYSTYGDESGCEYISAMLPSTGGSAGKIFGWIIMVLVVGGAATAFVMQKKKKAGENDASFGLMK